MGDKTQFLNYQFPDETPTELHSVDLFLKT